MAYVSNVHTISFENPVCISLLLFLLCYTSCNTYNKILTFNTLLLLIIRFISFSFRIVY